ncbi:hypothetical protein EDD36DRAFT_428609 [Exophiala viscosa]|uniref:C3H1-type domain-containing protein n=1 Tax=Exophiala viscosa TaxID=2486360 RepID=A0AAN6E3W8_9EURO|nr:hypothetical protein EDD36DRAFT_428609 [Exophiala viscosa]
MSRPTPTADTVGSEKANQGSTSVMKSTAVKRHQRVPYARRADPYPHPSSMATFERASSAVLKTLSWPQKQFNKWIAADIESSVQTAENHLVVLDDPLQALTLQSQLSPSTNTTIDAPAPAEIGTSFGACQTTSHGHHSLPNSHLPVRFDRKLNYENNSGPHVVNKKLCSRYSSTGSCPFGSQCYGIHDDNKLSLCPSVLLRKECSSGEHCDLSHVVTPERSPTCLFHLRGRCTRPDCPYSHANVDSNAAVCAGFAYTGYCDQGMSCASRHLRECPDYAKTGDCHKSRCRLPHVDRASQKRQMTSSSESDMSTAVTVVGSPEDGKRNDEWVPAVSDAAECTDFVSSRGDFSQQQDYISL